LLAAIQFISDGLAAGLFKGDHNARELQYMLLDPDPEKYSKVRHAQSHPNQSSQTTVVFDL
jgi:hypothetical protein